jgi:hypothetical protein
MRNVTITMDEDVARWARVQAAERDMSLARFVGDLLRQHMALELGYEQSMQAFLAIKPRGGSRGKPLPTREEIHDRAALRR